MSVAQVLASMSGDRNIVVVRLPFVKWTGSLEAAMLLDKVLYWWRTVEGRPFYKSDDEWVKDIPGATRYAVRQARDRLVAMGILVVRMDRHPSLPSKVAWYSIDEEAFDRSYNEWAGFNSRVSENEQLNPVEPPVERNRTVEDSEPDGRECESEQFLSKDASSTSSKTSSSAAAAAEASASDTVAGHGSPDSDLLRAIIDVLVEVRGTPWAKLLEPQRGECAEEARKLVDRFTIDEIRFGANAWWPWAREAFRREPLAPTFGQLRKHIESQAPSRRPAGPLFDDAPPTPSHAAPNASNAPPAPDATDVEPWKEPHLAPVLEALGYTPAACPDGERLAVDRLLSSAHRRGATKGLVIEAARRVAGRSQVTDRRRVAELQLELDAMAVGVVS